MLPVCRRLSVARSSWSCQCQLLALLPSLHAGLNSLVGLPRPREASVVLVVVTEHTTAVTLGHRALRPIPLETAASAAHKSVRVPILGGGGGPPGNHTPAPRSAAGPPATLAAVRRIQVAPALAASPPAVAGCTAEALYAADSCSSPCRDSRRLPDDLLHP